MGFRKPSFICLRLITSVASIRIISNDLEKSHSFYKNLFEVEAKEKSEKFISFKVIGINLDISLPDSKNPKSSGGTIAYFLCEDVNEVLKKVESLGGRLYRGPLKVAEISRMIMQIEDPAGSIIGFESEILV